MLSSRRPALLVAMAVVVALLLAVTLAVLLVPSLSWAGVLGWLTTEEVNV